MTSLIVCVILWRISHIHSAQKNFSQGRYSVDGIEFSNRPHFGLVNLCNNPLGLLGEHKNIL